MPPGTEISPYSTPTLQIVDKTSSVIDFRKDVHLSNPFYSDYRSLILEAAENIGKIVDGTKLLSANIALPNGNVKLSYGELDVDFYPTGKDEKKFYELLCKKLNDESEDYSPQTQTYIGNCARIKLNADGVDYAIKLEPGTLWRAIVEIEGVSQNHVADGHRFDRTGAYLTERLAKKASTVQKVMKDTKEKFNLDIAEIEPNNRITNICMLPKSIQKEDVPEFIRNAVKYGTLEYTKTYKFDKKWDSFLGMMYGTPNYRFTVNGENRTVAHMHAENLHPRLLGSSFRFIYYPLGFFPLNFDENTSVTYKSIAFPKQEKPKAEPKESRISELLGKGISAAGTGFVFATYPVWKPFHLAGKGISYLVRYADVYTDYIGDATRESNRIWEDVVAQTMKANGIEPNLDNPGCYTIIGDELWNEMRKEHRKRIDDYKLKQKEAMKRKINRK